MGFLWSSKLLKMQAEIQELNGKIKISQFYIDSFCSRELPEKARDFIKGRINLLKKLKQIKEHEYSKLKE